MPWDLACPACRGVLAAGDNERRCAQCGVTYRRRDGIWRFLTEGREKAFEKFIEQYETVRIAEGRRVQNPDHLRALPFRDLSRQRSYEWSIRSRSFETLVRRVVLPLEQSSPKQLRILDLGSGLGWLAYQLTLRGNEVAAVDISTNDFDGLGVRAHYDRAFLSVQAEFDHLPFRDRTVDLVVYNASFHYATDFASTLREALRVLIQNGTIVVMDTPIYRDSLSGAAMVRERENAFEQRYGFRGDALESEGFLTFDRLDLLERQLSVRWTFLAPWYGVRWWLKPLVAQLRGLREPAHFLLVIGRRAGES
jgi:SAM-dependent methyltransferase